MQRQEADKAVENCPRAPRSGCRNDSTGAWRRSHKHHKGSINGVVRPVSCVSVIASASKSGYECATILSVKFSVVVVVALRNDPLSKKIIFIFSRASHS